MERVQKIIGKIKEDPNCIYLPPEGEPNLPKGLSIPKDLSLFYQSIGSLVLFPDADFPVQIVSPNEFVRANPIIAGEEWEDDITYNWFIIAKSEGFGGQYVTIDLDKDRFGFCYDSYWDKHVNFDSPIIAKSFVEFLERTFETKGKEWFWADDDFENYGMSHEDLEPLN
jgi:hypothetical protein